MLSLGFVCAAAAGPIILSPGAAEDPVDFAKHAPPAAWTHNETSASPSSHDLRAMKNTSSTIKQFTLCLAAAASALALSACDSKQENAREDAVEQKADSMENKADAVRDSGEKKADAIEEQKSMSHDHSTNSALENKADATRDAAEQNADALENQADAVRDQTPAPTP